jgi:hypothetical protein
MSKPKLETMIDVQSALEQIAKLSSGVDVVFTDGMWTIESNVKEVELQVQHDNLWYAVNKMLDNVRSELVYPQPKFSDDWTAPYGWNDFGDSDYTCQCGSKAVQIRGWYQDGTPCSIAEFRCKHGHQWTTGVNCD